MINSFMPTGNERDLMLNYIDEALRLFGLPVQLIDIKEKSFYDDAERMSKSFWDIKVLLQDYVDKKLLANLSWHHIEKGEQGMTVFIPERYGGRDLHIVTGQVLRFQNGDLFKITEISQAYLVGLWRVCRIVPYIVEDTRDRENKRFKTQYFDAGRVEDDDWD